MADLISESVKRIENNEKSLRRRDFINAKSHCSYAHWLLAYSADPLNYMIGIDADLGSSPSRAIYGCVFYGLMTATTLDQPVENTRASHLKHIGLARVMNHYFPNPVCNQVAHDLLYHNNGNFSTSNLARQAELSDQYAKCLRQTLDAYALKKKASPM